MGSGVVALLAFALVGQQASDTTTYADRATRDLVARAVARHATADTTVRDYQAHLRYRISFGIGQRRWASVPTAAVEEQDGTVHWSLPNDLRVDILGRREASRLDGVNLASSFDRPWFVPRTLGDSIRILGGDASARAAPHPLSRGAEAIYRYAAGDSLVIAMQGRRFTIRSITIMPRETAAVAVAGRIWINVESGDVVRFAFRFVGRELWTDLDDEMTGDTVGARRTGRIVQQLVQVDADLEYSLQENKYWLPARQVLSGRVTVPLGGGLTVPFEATTTFEDYTVNSGKAVAFTAPFRDSTSQRSREERVAARDSVRAERRKPGLPDSLRARDNTGYLARGGRYQVHRPPVDSLRQYAAWSDSLVLEQDPVERARLREAMADVAGIVEDLSPEISGKPGFGFAWEKIPDMVRFNRVQGTTFSYGQRFRAPWNFTTLYATARYGLADSRLMATGAIVRDAPSGRFTISGGRDLADIDAWARGLTFGNSLRGMLVGRDEGAYLLSQGVRLQLERSAGLGKEMLYAAYVADHSSVGVEAKGGLLHVFDKQWGFSANPSVREGLATGGLVRYTGQQYGSALGLSVEGLAVDGEVAGRVTADWRQSWWRGAVTLRLKGGLAEGADVVPQMALRAGGLNTVRGYDFGVATGDALWSAQLDLMRAGRGAVKTVLFADAGQAGRRADFGSAPFLSGAGVGVSVLGGIIRAELSHPITERAGRGLRFDLIFGGVR